jgi:hypothetical protein
MIRDGRRGVQAVHDATTGLERVTAEGGTCAMKDFTTRWNLVPLYVNGLLLPLWMPLAPLHKAAAGV